jgi:hypothetical protein
MSICKSRPLCQHFSADGRDISLAAGLKKNPRLHFVEAELDLSTGKTNRTDKTNTGVPTDQPVPASKLHLYNCNARTCPYPVHSYGLTKVVNGRRVPDDFKHEQYLLVEENGRRVLFSGCSHKGILNIMSWFKPDVLLGGFHFMKLDPATERQRAFTGSGENFSRLSNASTTPVTAPAKRSLTSCTNIWATSCITPQRDRL